MAQDSVRDGAGNKPSGGGDRTMSEAWTVLSHLLSGLLMFGLAGWGIDQLLGTSWVLLVGLLVGGAASFALIYVRYLHVPPTDQTPRPGGPAGPENRKEQHG